MSSSQQSWFTDSPQGIELLKLAIQGEWSEGRSPLYLVRLLNSLRAKGA